MADERERLLAQTKAEALECRRCRLWQTRTQVVFGEGNPHASLMLVGEGPGESEDKQGHPFVGRAGALLNRALASVGIERDQIWLSNVVRSRPTVVQAGVLRNRAPRTDEAAACSIWMKAELDLVRPRVVVCLGAVPASFLIHKQFRVNAERATFFDADGTRRMATFHPAYILRLKGDDYTRTLALLEQDLAVAAAEASMGE